MDSRPGFGSGVRVQCTAQTHNIATATTGSTADRGTTSRSSTAEGLKMPAALTDLNGRSTKLEVSLKRPEKAFFSPNAALLTTGNSDLGSMMTGNSGVSSMVAEDIIMAFIMAGGSGVANRTGQAATLANEVADEAALAGVDSGCNMAAILGADSGCGMGVVTDTGLAIISVWHGGNPVRPDSMATGAHSLLPPCKKCLGETSSSTVNSDPQNNKTKSIYCARDQPGSSSGKLRLISKSSPLQKQSRSKASSPGPSRHGGRPTEVAELNSSRGMPRRGPHSEHPPEGRDMRLTEAEETALLETHLAARTAHSVEESVSGMDRYALAVCHNLTRRRKPSSS
ncbi:hypothetical protein G5714_007932 [Onychostoma macrolepis]|uniref:Uncharacterized protein n=1 Tax=Onychostoma macrolepis TaxID=369639 RepID=A0A7J6CUV8_9TELE|nr:hypothetical protein G5714_007932 [Onychostoma macrolepis]